MQVSQFTLYALAKGNKPDYHLAMPPTKVQCTHSSHADEVNSLMGWRDSEYGRVSLSVRRTAL